jgi:striatin 1/3/4
MLGPGPLQNIQQQPQQPQQGPGGPQNVQSAIPPPPPQNGQDGHLSGILHFLQTEWRRYERDRNEWEIERAEMRVCFLPCPLCPIACPNGRPCQARIALLEGERRSFENVKLDLMRRIKMLEYALRMERYALQQIFFT